MSAGHGTGPTVRVWDLLVRAGHWTLVGGIAATWLTHGKWHEWLGYAVLAVVTLRVVWGFVGSRYARFAQFLHRPAATLSYGKHILTRSEPRHLGHNPLGGWMIAALLVTITGICATGWLARRPHQFFVRAGGAARRRCDLFVAAAWREFGGSDDSWAQTCAGCK
jgi:cytochrome b